MRFFFFYIIIIIFMNLWWGPIITDYFAKHVKCWSCKLKYSLHIKYESLFSAFYYHPIVFVKYVNQGKYTITPTEW